MYTSIIIIDTTLEAFREKYILTGIIVKQTDKNNMLKGRIQLIKLLTFTYL